jgi:hypothetical protein
VVLRNRNLLERLDSFFSDTPSRNQFTEKCDEYLFSTLLLAYFSKSVFIYFFAGIQMGACQGQ